MKLLWHQAHSILIFWAPVLHTCLSKEMHTGSLCYFNISKHCASKSVEQVKEVVSLFSYCSLFIKTREGNEWKQSQLTQRPGKVAWPGKTGFKWKISTLVLSHLVKKVMQALVACFKAKKMFVALVVTLTSHQESSCKRKLGVLCPNWIICPSTHS